MGPTMVHLPDEVIVEILLRLPVKSLLRFRSVSKSWLSLISDPQFAKSHFELAYARTDRLIYLTASRVRSLDPEASFHDDYAIVRLNFPLELNFWLPTVGSCRGLLLFDNYPSLSLFVWNPSTGVHKQVPYPAIVVFPFLFGLGYDPSTDDYLIVIASYDLEGDFGSAHFQFFSLKTNSWKKIESDDFPYMNHMDETRAGALTNGAIHWLAFRHDICQDVIVVFDLTEKNLREMPLPDAYDILLDGCDFVVLGGFLCLCDNDGDTWVMKEYGVQSSWTRVDKVETPTSYFMPICHTKCGDTVGKDGRNGLLKFNHNGVLLEHREFCLDQHGCQVALYTESLLTLPLGEEGEDGQQ
ncbi:hypothetical protein L6164_012653 [Bauhinia variegata]|uniref:Uncharacterized protein n=1 Tax=Bauhinia variegata TaxID=167791 RepID=A0ACB9PAN8_BAUVA|nr:hypothetical protein L6164_012653 [Bauhinia variegata]